MEIDEDNPSNLEATGAVLCLNVPTGTNFGLDYKCWTVGEKFKGVTQVPPGVHFIYSSPEAPDQAFAPRMGAFFYLAAGEVYVQQWSPELEYFCELDDREQEQRLKLGVKAHDFDEGLGPYPDENVAQWTRLTNFITKAVLSKVAPVKSHMASTALCEEKEEARKKAKQAAGGEKRASATAAAQQKPSTRQPAKPPNEMAMADDCCGPEENEEEARGGTPKPFDPKHPRDIAPYCVDGSTFRAFYTPIPREKLGGTPAERTKRAMDKSWQLEALLKLYAKDTAGNAVPEPECEKLLLGEIQFAFVSFLIGQCFDALEQWKGLLMMMCNCEDAFEQRGGLFAGFVTVLLGQLKELPTDFFTDEILEGSFLKPAVTSLVEIARL